MTVSSLKTGTESLGLLAGNLRVGNGFELLASVSLSATAATVSFTSIPQTYKHIQIRSFSRNSSGDYQLIRFNGDTSANYAWHQLRGSGSGAATAARVSNTTYGEIPFNAYNSLSANIFGACVTDILDYSNTTTFKTVRSFGGADANGSGSLVLASSLWRSTSAITRIDLYPDSNYLQYSNFALYGIAG